MTCPKKGEPGWEDHLKRKRDRHKKDPLERRRCRIHDYRQRFDVTPEELEGYNKIQKCQLCGDEFKFTILSDKPKAGCPKGTACLDHCHETGKIRGVICMGCNIIVGMFERRMRQRLFSTTVKWIETQGNLPKPRRRSRGRPQGWSLTIKKRLQAIREGRLIKPSNGGNIWSKAYWEGVDTSHIDAENGPIPLNYSI
jgi:hypothetical protein